MGEFSGIIETPTTDAFFTRVSPLLGAAATATTVECIQHPVQHIQAYSDAQGGKQEGLHRSMIENVLLIIITYNLIDNDQLIGQSNDYLPPFNNPRR